MIWERVAPGAQFSGGWCPHRADRRIFFSEVVDGFVALVGLACSCFGHSAPLDGPRDGSVCSIGGAELARSNGVRLIGGDELGGWLKSLKEER